LINLFGVEKMSLVVITEEAHDKLREISFKKKKNLKKIVSELIEKEHKKL